METKFVLRSANTPTDQVDDVEDYEIIFATLQRLTGGKIRVEPALMITIDGTLATPVEQILEASNALYYHVFGGVDIDPAAVELPKVDPYPYLGVLCLKTDEKSAGAVIEQPVCRFCGQPFERARKNQTICTKPECKKAYGREWRARNGLGRKSEPVAATADPTPSDADEMDLIGVELATASAIDYPWLIEDGKDKGKRLSAAQLRRLLVAGDLKLGQHLRHAENGQHRVVKATYPSQKLERMFGDSMAYYVLPAEL